MDITKPGWHHTAESKHKISISLKGRPSPLRGRLMPMEVRRKISQTLSRPNPRQSEIMKEVWKRPEYRKLALEVLHSADRSMVKKRLKELWLNPEKKAQWIRANLLACQKGPNISEKALSTLLVPLGFSYIGDGQLIVAGKCPDFWNGDH